MYNVGDKIVHPMHGAGTIKQVEKREILGEVREYYILEVSCEDMGVMIPVDNCEAIGVRPVSSREEIEGAMEVLGEPTGHMHENWNKRYRENMEKFKTGDLVTVARLVRDLTRADSCKRLSSGEKKMLTSAMRVLKSEVMVSMDTDSGKAGKMIEDAIAQRRCSS